MSNKLKQKLSDVMNIPDELITDSPKIEFESNRRVWIENYRGIIEYTDELVRVNTADFIIIIAGSEFTIFSVTLDDLCIDGNITSVEFKSREDI